MSATTTGSKDKPTNSPASPDNHSDEITDNPVWTKGDIIIISSDNVRFRVPKYRLMAASTVLRDLISIPNSSGDNTITFTDPEIETAEIISHFLEFSHCRDKCFWPYFPEFPTVLIVRLAEFLNKYNGQVAIHVLTRAVWSALNDDEIEIQVVFLLAVMFDDDSLRNAVLRVINVGSLMDMGQGKSLKSRESRVKKAYEFFRRLPPKYGFALFRTFICSTEETGYGDVNHFIDTLLFIE